MNFDLALANATAWVMTNGLWLAAVGAAYLAGRYAAPAWMRRRICTLGRVQYAVNAEKKLQAFSDGLACAEMELQWEEER